jgi:hypothetical protein
MISSVLIDRAIPEENYTKTIEVLCLINFIYSIERARADALLAWAGKRLAVLSAQQPQH